MKKNIVIFLICIMTVVISIFALSACGNGNNTPDDTSQSETQTVTVSFVVDGAKIDEKMIINGGNITDLPVVPKKKGYEGTWNITDLSNITRDITVSAVYTPKTYMLTFDYDGVILSDSIKNKAVTYNAAIGVLPEPKREGFVFEGWQIDGKAITSAGVWSVDRDKTAVGQWRMENATGLEYSLSDDGEFYIVSGLGTEKRVFFSVPSEHDGKPVKEIANYAFQGCSDIEGVTIPNGVTRMGKYAFQGCSSLEEITIPFIGAEKDGKINNKFTHIFGNIPSSLKKVVILDGTSILEKAFYNCWGLSSITLPDTVTSIGTSAFEGCFNLKSITIPSGVASIGSNAFCGCNYLTNITIPCSVTNVDNSAFENCDRLTEVNYMGTIDQWVQIAFNNCLSNPLNAGAELYINDELLTEANITTAKKVNTYVFYNCTPLTSITIGDSVEKIECGAFNGCASLEEITIPFIGTIRAEHGQLGIIFGTDSYKGGMEAVYQLGNTFRYTYYIPETLKRVVVNSDQIPDGSFCNCSNLESITIPNTVVKIGDFAFFHCSKLKNITIPDSVKSIGNGAFEGCNAFKSITIPKQVTSIGGSAFYECNNLKKVIYTGTIDQWVQIDFYEENSNPMCYAEEFYINNTLLTDAKITTSKINSYAFSGYKKLLSATIPDGVTDIADHLFYYCSGLTKVTIPSSVTSIGECAFQGCSSLKNITIPDKVTRIGEYAFYSCRSFTKITVPNSVKNIGAYAFGNCDGLENIILGNGIKSIEDNTFNCCSALKSIEIPYGVTSIGDSAFNLCYKMTSVAFPESLVNIGDKAFSSCSSLKNITMPDSVTSVGDYAFNGCKALTDVTIGKGLKSIGIYAFYQCSALSKVTFENIDGWYTTYDVSSALKTSIVVADPIKNANNLKASYATKYWKRK